MTPNPNADLILANDLQAAAASEDFTSISETLNAATITVNRPDPVSMGETGIALGEDAVIVLEALESTATGRSTLQKLTVSGLHYWHPLTQAALKAEVAAGRISQAIVDKMIGLSVRMESIAEQAAVEVTAESLQAGWTQHTDGETQARKRGFVQDALIVVVDGMQAGATRANVLAAFSAALITEGWE